MDYLKLRLNHYQRANYVNMCIVECSKFKFKSKKIKFQNFVYFPYRVYEFFFRKNVCD